MQKCNRFYEYLYIRNWVYLENISPGGTLYVFLASFRKPLTELKRTDKAFELKTTNSNEQSFLRC
jgi:hypothetical protein